MFADLARALIATFACTCGWGAVACVYRIATCELCGYRFGHGPDCPRRRVRV